MEFHQNGDSEFGIPRVANRELMPQDMSSQKTSACGTSFNLVAPYNTNNGQRGCMFNITASTTVTVHCFDANLYSGTTADYEIYYRPGTHVGNENSSAGWTMLGSTTALTSAGNNVPTAIPITFNVTIPAGQTYAFYVTNTFGGGTSYTDGAAVGNFLAGDANITIYEGVGKSYPFGLTFTVRNFNGHIYYNNGFLDAGSVGLSARPAIGGVLVGWALDHPEEVSRAVIERSEGNGKYELIRQIDVQSTDNHWTDADFPAGKDLSYRIQYTDMNGVSHFSNVEEVSAASLEKLQEVFVYPQPFSGQLNYEFISQGKGNWSVQLHDLNGKLLQSESFETLEAGPVNRSLDGSGLPSGVYILSLIGNHGRKVIRVNKL